MDITPSEIALPGNGSELSNTRAFGAERLVAPTTGPKAIRQILRSTGWSEDDLRRLGLLP
jgi:hypothetical protein